MTIFGQCRKKIGGSLKNKILLQRKVKTVHVFCYLGGIISVVMES